MSKEPTLGTYLEVRSRDCRKMMWLRKAVLEALLEGETVNICCVSEEAAKRTFDEFVEFFKVIA